MPDTTHADIISRIDALEEGKEQLDSRMASVEEAVRSNRDIAQGIGVELVAHRAEFTEKMSLWDGYLKGVVFSAKVFAWLVGTGIALAAILSQL